MTDVEKTAHAVLNDTYGDSKFNDAVNRALAEDIAFHLEHGREYPWGVRHWNRDDLINYIWMAHSGGSTAEYVADLIIEKAGIIFKEDVKYV